MAQNRIRELREAAGLTLEAVAGHAGTTNQQISLLESGQRRLTVDWMIKIAAVLGCHPWRLVSADDGVVTSPEEERLLHVFRELAAPSRERLLDVANNLQLPH